VRKIYTASYNTDLQYFLRQQFFAAIEAAHFPAGGTAIDACAAAIFTYLFQG
jgi:hypothetical protein